jgi:glycerophosphoryl diester phosphodiesterase
MKTALLTKAALPLLLAGCALAAPFARTRRWSNYFDVQGHRGARGEAVESTLLAFARGLIDGVTTLEMDNGITADGHTIVWHDEDIQAEKCNDTAPAFEGDPLFPYVGRFVANLTLAQIKTLDCGSERLPGFPLQLEAPGLKISTLPELFDFVECTQVRLPA